MRNALKAIPAGLIVGTMLFKMLTEPSFSVAMVLMLAMIIGYFFTFDEVNIEYSSEDEKKLNELRDEFLAFKSTIEELKAAQSRLNLSMGLKPQKKD